MPDRHRRRERRMIEQGSRRIPGGLLTPEAAKAIHDLVESGYATSKAGVICRALEDAKNSSEKC